MVASARQSDAAAAGLSPLHAVLLIAFAALSAAQADAVRLDGRAMVEAQGKPSRRKATKMPKQAGGDQDASNIQCKHELRLASDYVQAVQVTDNIKLGTIKDTIDSLETLRQGLSDSGVFRGPEQRKIVRALLRDIRVKIDSLKPLVAMKEAAGEVDDGGGTLPSLRPNICMAKEVEADDDFAAEIDGLCGALDAVRKAFAARKFEAAAAFEVVGRMANIKASGWYAHPSIARGFNAVLNEEKRWVTKEIAARAARGEPCERVAKILDMWIGEDFVSNLNNYSPAARENALREASEVAAGTVVNDNTTLSVLRTQYDLLQVHKDELERILPVSLPQFTDRVHAMLRSYDIKMQLIKVRARQREAEGDVDDGGDVPPTRRVSICSRIDEYNVEAEIKAEIKDICATLDRMREVVLSGGNADAASFEVLGRAIGLKALPGYAEMPIARELDVVLDEEYRWAKTHWDHENNRPKEPPPRLTTAVPTAPPPSVAAAMVDSAQQAGFLEARKVVQAITAESSANLNANARNHGRLDVIKETVLVMGTPQNEQVDRELKLLTEKGEELETFAEAFQTEGSKDDSVVSDPEHRSQGEEENNLISKFGLGWMSAEEDNLISSAEDNHLVSEPVLDSFESEDGNLISEPELGSLDEDEDHLISKQELGPQSPENDDVTSEDVVAAPCVNTESYDLRPTGHAQFEDVSGESRMSRSTVSGDDAAKGCWTCAIGDLVRRIVALFTACPRMMWHFLLMLAQEKPTTLRQLPQRRPVPEAPPNASADGADVADGTDVGVKTPGGPSAPADASVDGADDTVQ